MKKNKKMIFQILIMACMISACSIPETKSGSEKSDTMGSQKEDTAYYTKITAGWPVYESAEKLIDAGKIVIIGEVTDISFKILNKETSEETDSKDENGYLHTIYRAEVECNLKGNTTDEIQIQMIGGRDDIKVEEQLSVLGDNSCYGIPILVGMRNIEVGKKYLFVIHQYREKMPTLINVDQGVFSLEEQLKKDETSIVSLKEVNSKFGDETWNNCVKKFGIEE